MSSASNQARLTQAMETISRCGEEPPQKRKRDLDNDETVHPPEFGDLVGEDETSLSGTSSSASSLDSESESEDIDNHENSDDTDSPDEETSTSSDSQDSSEADSTELITSMPTPTEPSHLQSRLKEFLPKLQKANAELRNEDYVLERRIDDVGEDEEHYIEMNLGLGVLSKQEGDEEENLALEEPSMEDDDKIAKIKGRNDSTGKLFEHDIMSQLRGEKRQQGQKRKIEEVG